MACPNLQEALQEAAETAHDLYTAASDLADQIDRMNARQFGDDAGIVCALVSSLRRALHAYREPFSGKLISGNER
jgi:hypothetical protein